MYAVCMIHAYFLTHSYFHELEQLRRFDLKSPA